MPVVEEVHVAPTGRKDVGYDPEKHLNKEGTRLALYVLIGVGVVLCFAGTYYFAQPSMKEIAAELMPIIKDFDDAQKIEMTKLFFAEFDSRREFVLDLSKSTLINVFLPIMTAILGYVFASRNSKNS